MNCVLTLAIAATVLSGLFGGMGLQKLVVELPARKRIGPKAFAQYARSADLGNGLYVYPSVAVISAVTTIAAFVSALRSHTPSPAVTLLGVASGAALGVLAMTIFAAPKMLSVPRVGDEATLAGLFDDFVRYSWPRGVFMWLQFALLLWAVRIL